VSKIDVTDSLQNKIGTKRDNQSKTKMFHGIKYHCGSRMFDRDFVEEGPPVDTQDFVEFGCFCSMRVHSSIPLPFLLSDPDPFTLVCAEQSYELSCTWLHKAKAFHMVSDAVARAIPGIQLDRWTMPLLLLRQHYCNALS
jgi:hypothetical protein